MLGENYECDLILSSSAPAQTGEMSLRRVITQFAALANILEAGRTIVVNRSA